MEQLMTNMIEGINPFSISKIYATGFRRIGPHPSWTKVMCKRNPIRGFFGMYSEALFDGTYPASNDEAIQYAKHLNSQLDDFLSSLTSQCKMK
jgi:hypothetical protein